MRRTTNGNKLRMIDYALAAILKDVLEMLLVMAIVAALFYWFTR